MEKMSENTKKIIEQKIDNLIHIKKEMPIDIHETISKKGNILLNGLIVKFRKESYEITAFNCNKM